MGSNGKVACRRRSTPTLPFSITGTVLAGCAGPQSTLDPQGPVAASIATAWWVMFGGAVAIVALVMTLVLYSMFRDPAKRPQLATVPFLAGAGVAFPVVVLTALLIYGTDLGRRITRAADNPLHVEVTGHRWWWEVRYPNGPGPQVITANELRLPTNVPIELSVGSGDVIHSFWVPNLSGKIDMIPGRINTLRLMAHAAGRFNVQCSEFCGAQHAHMGLIVIAEPAADFERWRIDRAGDAVQVQGPGLERFLDLGCADCHAIVGTPAAGTGGPVLTHIADRPTLGATAAANSPDALRSWLADHGRTLKPGSRGPATRTLAPADVETLARFLQQLR
jgi:cytochrome c oxidase subunit 2